MRNELLALLAVFFVSIAQCALMPFLPHSLALVSPALMLVSALCLNLRFRTAILSATTFGITADLLGVAPFGIHTASAVTAVAVTALLLYRVLTHHTVGALAAANVAVFVLFHLTAYLLNGIVRALTEAPFFHPASWLALFMIAIALPLQVCMAIAVRLLTGRFYGHASKFILIK